MSREEAAVKVLEKSWQGYMAAKSKAEAIRQDEERRNDEGELAGEPSENGNEAKDDALTR